MCSEELKCVTGQWRCKDGLTCIAETRVCNREKDCFDGSDEMFCGTLSLSSPHPSLSLRCTQGLNWGSPLPTSDLRSHL